jgi:hypothetical protein
MDEALVEHNVVLGGDPLGVLAFGQAAGAEASGIQSLNGLTS